MTSSCEHKQSDKNIPSTADSVKLPKKFIACGAEYSLRRCTGRGAYYNADDRLVYSGREPHDMFTQLRNILHECTEVAFDEHMCKFENKSGEVFFYCDHDQFTAIIGTVAKLFEDTVKLNMKK